MNRARTFQALREDRNSKDLSPTLMKGLVQGGDLNGEVLKDLQSSGFPRFFFFNLAKILEGFSLKPYLLGLL